MLDDWVHTLCRDLDIDPKDPDISEILDLARDAAHTLARPAAPITTFLAGYAAGLRGGGREVVAQATLEVMAAIAAEEARQSGGDAVAAPQPDAAAQDQGPEPVGT